MYMYIIYVQSESTVSKGVDNTVTASEQLLLTGRVFVCRLDSFLE